MMAHWQQLLAKRICPNAQPPKAVTSRLSSDDHQRSLPKVDQLGLIPEGVLWRIHMFQPESIPEPEPAIQKMAAQFHVSEHSWITLLAIFIVGGAIQESSTVERPEKLRYLLQLVFLWFGLALGSLGPFAGSACLDRPLAKDLGLPQG